MIIYTWCLVPGRYYQMFSDSTLVSRYAGTAYTSRSSGHALPLLLYQVCDDDDDVLTLALISLKSRPWSQRQALPESLEGSKQTSNEVQKLTCTAAVPLRKRTVFASCGIPSCITCNQTIPGAYVPPMLFYVHSKEKKNGRGQTKQRNIKRK
ncbi:unnamed protein product [Laminaria digitata]